MWATAIAATRISENQQLRGGGVLGLPVFHPPPSARRNSEFRSIGGYSDVDRALIVKQIIDAVRRRAPNGLGQKIMHVDFNRSFSPGLTGLFEITDQLFLLRVHADGGLTRALKFG